MGILDLTYPTRYVPVKEPRNWTANEIWLRNEFSLPVTDVMRFRLVWQGPLVATGNKSRPVEVAKIRHDLSSQFQNLWDTHNSLQVLREYCWVRQPGDTNLIMDPSAKTPRQLAEKRPNLGMINLCEPISVGNKTYTPLIRASLHLNCELDILFLRQEDPGQLVLQGGDIDGRIKTLFDALRVPSLEEQNKASLPDEERLFCLLKSDALISAFKVETDRLLFPKTEKANEVFLVIEVSVNVLRVFEYNTCLI